MACIVLFHSQEATEMISHADQRVLMSHQDTRRNENENSSIEADQMP